MAKGLAFVTGFVDRVLKYQDALRKENEQKITVLNKVVGEDNTLCFEKRTGWHVPGKWVADQYRITITGKEATMQISGYMHNGTPDSIWVEHWCRGRRLAPFHEPPLAYAGVLEVARRLWGHFERMNKRNYRRR